MVKPDRWSKLVVVLAGAVAAAGATVVAGSAQVPSGGALQPTGGGQQTSRGGQEPTGGAQEPDEFRLTQREGVGEEGQRVRVGSTQMIFDSIFEFTDTVNDLFVWGWKPTISGDITDNAFLGGQRIQITPEGEIGGDLFLFAQDGRIDGRVGGDLYAWVAELSIGEGAAIDGAMNGGAGTLTLDGVVGGPITFASGVVTINGTVNGDVRLDAGELELGPNAVITGELRYESPREADIDPGARVDGEIRYYPPRDDDDEAEDEVPAAAVWFSLWNILWDAWWLLSSFLVGALALALGGDAARRPAHRLLEQPALGLGFGFVIAVVVPAAAILAIVLLVTIPLGLISIAVYMAAAYLARLVAALAIGHTLLRLLRGGKTPSPYASLALGLLAFYLLTQIPYVGFLIWLAAIVAGLGGMFLATRPMEPDSASPAPVAVG
jgi:cytoskeletal protein CcmA (bactofilin family)